MTALALKNPYQPFTRAINTGSSPESKKLQQKIEEMVCHFRDMVARQSAFLDLARLATASREADWDQYGGRALSDATSVVAMRFLSALPTALPSPEVGIDPDGEVAFEWLGVNGRVFTVSANLHGRLSYAGIFGEGQTAHGTENFVDTIPPTIIRSIERVDIAS